MAGWESGSGNGGVNPLLTGGTNSQGGGGVGGQSQPQPRAADQTGFGGIATQLGLSNNYNATAAPADYGGHGYGSGDYQAGVMRDKAGALAANQTNNGSFGQGTYNSFSAQNGRVAGDYQRASQQADLASGLWGNQAAMANKTANQQNIDQGIAAQMAMAKSGNPATSGLNQYNAAQNGARMMQQGAASAAMQGQQVQQAYDQMNLNAGLQNRQMNLGMLGLSQQDAMNAAQSALQNGQLNQQQYLDLLKLQQQYAAQGQQGQEAYAALASGNYNAAQGINSGIAGQQGQAGSALLSGIVGAMAGGMSGGATMGAGSMGGGGGGVAGGGGGDPLNSGQNMGTANHPVYDISSNAANM